MLRWGEGGGCMGKLLLIRGRMGGGIFCVIYCLKIEKKQKEICVLLGKIVIDQVISNSN